MHNLLQFYGYTDPDSLIIKTFQKNPEEELTIDSIKEARVFAKIADWISKMDNSGMVINRRFFNNHKYLYSYSSFKPSMLVDATPIPTGIHDDRGREIIGYHIEGGYQKFSTDVPISIINYRNLYKMVLRHLINFQIFNGLQRRQVLRCVLESFMAQVIIRKRLDIKDADIDLLIDNAMIKAEKVMERVGCYSLPERLAKLNLLKTHHYYVYSAEFDRRMLMGTVVARHKTANTDMKVYSTIDEMMYTGKFICVETIKEICGCGRNQIRRTFRERKQDINQYNLESFGVKTLKKYNQLNIN